MLDNLKHLYSQDWFIIGSIIAQLLAIILVLFIIKRVIKLKRTGFRKSVGDELNQDIWSDGYNEGFDEGYQKCLSEVEVDVVETITKNSGQTDSLISNITERINEFDKSDIIKASKQLMDLLGISDSITFDTPEEDFEEDYPEEDFEDDYEEDYEEDFEDDYFDEDYEEYLDMRAINEKRKATIMERYRALYEFLLRK